MCVCVYVSTRKQVQEHHISNRPYNDTRGVMPYILRSVVALARSSSPMKKPYIRDVTTTQRDVSHVRKCQYYIYTISYVHNCLCVRGLFTRSRCLICMDAVCACV